MKNKKGKKNKEAGSSKSGYSALSTLGEDLKQKNPALLKKFEELQGAVSPVTRWVEVIHDLLPFPWKDSGLFEEGIQLAAEENYDKAVGVFKEVLRIYPDAYPAYHLLGYVFGCLKNYKEEIENYRKAIKCKPNYPQVYYNLGVVYLLRRREKKAFAAFMRAVDLAREFEVADYWLTFCFERLGRFRKASQGNGKEAVKAARVHANTYYFMGNAFLEFGLHIPSRQAYKKAVRIWPEFSRAYYQLGLIHLKRLRNPKRAVKYLERAEHLFVKQNDLPRAALTRQLYCPVDEVLEKDKAAEDWLKEGVRLQQFGRYQGAVDACKKAVSFKQDFVDAFYNMGIAYGSLEETGGQVLQKAIWVFKKAIQLKPDFIHAYIALGASYIKENQFEEAIAVLKEALTYGSSEPNVYYYLGVANRLSGHLDDANRFLHEAVTLKPDSIQVQFTLGLTLIDLMQYAEACDVFQEVVRIKPDFADGHFMLGSLYHDKIVDLEKSAAHFKKAEKLFIKLEDYSRAAQIQQLLTHQPV